MAVDDSYTKLLLHFNGTDGSTTFTDEAGNTVTAEGSAQIDTAQSKFGGASGLFSKTTNDYLTVPDSNYWQLDGGSDSNSWTIDFWVRFPADPSTGYEGFIGQYVNTNNYWGLVFSTNSLVLMAEDGGTELFKINPTWNPAADTWYHVAVVKNGTTGYKMFIDGTQLADFVADSTPIANDNTTLDIGRACVNSTMRYSNIWMDELRVSIGVARWTSNFTPPAYPYLPALSGTLSKTIDAVSISSAGKAEVEGVSSKTIDAVSVSSAGKTEVEGVASSTIADVTLVAAGEVTTESGDITGELSQAIDAVAISSAGKAYVSGTLSKSIDSTTVSSAGKTHVSGALSQSVDAISISSAGKLYVVGEFSKSIEDITLVSAGTSESLISGSLEITIDSISSVSSGEVDISGVASNAIDSFSISSSGKVIPRGTLSKTIDAVTSSSAGVVRVRGTTSKTIDAISISSSGKVYISGLLNKSIGSVVSTGEGTSATIILGELSSEIDPIITEESAMEFIPSFQYDLEIHEGESWSMETQILGPDGRAADLTYYEFYMQVRNAHSGEIYADISTDSGISISGNLATLSMTSVQTSSIQPHNAIYDLFMVSPHGKHSRLFYGDVIMKKAITVVEA
jgi:hypothetical protein